MSLSSLLDLTTRIRREIGKAVVGQEEAVHLLMIGLLCRGHVLLEGVPGTAKTLLARAFAATLDLHFGRIQFTPDLMPGDVTGTNLFDFRTGEFSLTKGPVFTDILLADEINRTPPKTQSALLEAMQERKVTIDGKTNALGDSFLVIATQNPIEQQGTYPLPEAQLDRFLFKHIMTYPSLDEERTLVRLHGESTEHTDVAQLGVSPVADAAALGEIRALVGSLRLTDPIIHYIVDLIRATREHRSLSFGASPRAASQIALAARARAALDGRDYVIPDDVKMLAPAALRHRLVLSPSAEIEGLTAEAIVAQVIEQTPAPR